MKEMFANCRKLQQLDVSHFNTSKVANMRMMFIWCGNLTKLDVSHFDTSNVTDMKEMFNGCSKLRVIDVSHFDTGKAVIMDELFHRCNSLETVDVSNFKTSQTDNLHEMFRECRMLTTLNLSSFNTKQVTQMYRMFDGCTALKTIFVSNDWSTEKVEDSSSMFNNCTSLVGEMGTIYDGNNTDHTYAHIDGGVNNPGYLSRLSYNRKCATPTIAYDKGELVFTCETEGVTFFSEVKVADAKSNEGERVKLDTSYIISVYATKEGYAGSDEATAIIQWRDGRPLFEGFSSVTVSGSAGDSPASADVNGDGTVDVADIATIISEMATRARMQKIED